jgi:hypothetical protein
MARRDQQLAAAQRADHVVRRYTEDRWTFAQIGAEMGVSRQYVHEVWTKALASMPTPRLSEYRREAVQFADQRVQELIALQRQPGTAGRTYAELERQIIGWEERKAKVLGVDSPTRREVQVVTDDALSSEIRKLTAEMTAMTVEAQSYGIDLSELDSST